MKVVNDVDDHGDDIGEALDDPHEEESFEQGSKDHQDHNKFGIEAPSVTCLEVHVVVPKEDMQNINKVP